MKTIIALLLLTPFANACPNLEGTYLCLKNESHPDTIYNFTQKAHAADWLFKMVATPVGSTKGISYQFLTDGFERETTEVNSGTKLLLTASCTPELLTVTGVANFDKPQKIHFSEKLSLDKENNLVDESINIRGETIVETCVRQ